jgi:hypothetical protein
MLEFLILKKKIQFFFTCGDLKKIFGQQEAGMTGKNIGKSHIFLVTYPIKMGGNSNLKVFFNFDEKN